jgi:hypothetical protein
MVDNQPINRHSLVQDIPADRADDLDFIVDLVDWNRNLDTNFKAKHYIEPILASGSEDEGFFDRWVVYGTISDEQKFSAKELTVLPQRSCTLEDASASGAILVQGHGRVGKLSVDCPSIIRFGQMTSDEIFISAAAAIRGVRVENHSETDPLVLLRYFGPDVHADMPGVGDHAR